MDAFSTRLKFAVSTAVLLFIAPALVSASQDTTLSANQLSKYYTDAQDVVENLDNYQALWIKIHGCV
jgi:hypothetical protein